MLYAVVMAGGSGTRFWPASRNSHPKQLLQLAGERSMIQMTIDRVKDICDVERSLIVTNRRLVDSISQQLPEFPIGGIIGEPCKRDTAPCIGLAAAWLMKIDPEATMLVMPADHVINTDEDFHGAIRHAESMIESDPDCIVTFGIKPSYPAETFGYIERNESEAEHEAGPKSFRVKRFREKPDLETARQFLASGGFYWNSGIFLWKAKTILNALKKFEPEMHSHICRIGESIGTDDFESVLDEEFSEIDGKSIDYAVLERFDNVRVVEAPFAWDDVGNWTALPRLRGVDADGNTIIGDHIGINTSNTIVFGSHGHVVATVGLDNFIVVQTPEATLVASRDNEESIRDVVKRLNENGLDKYL